MASLDFLGLSEDEQQIILDSLISGLSAEPEKKKQRIRREPGFGRPPGFGPREEPTFVDFLLGDDLDLLRQDQLQRQGAFAPIPTQGPRDVIGAFGKGLASDVGMMARALMGPTPGTPPVGPTTGTPPTPR